VVRTSRGWKLAGIHLGSTTDDQSPMIQVLLSSHQLGTVGIHGKKRKPPVDSATIPAARDSLSSEESPLSSFLENMGYFSTATAIATRLPGKIPDFAQSAIHSFPFEDDELYDDSEDSDN